MLPEDAATFEVHAASKLSWRQPRDSDQEEFVAAVWGDVQRDGGMRRFIAFAAKGKREMAAKLFSTFQDTFWLSIKTRDAGRTDSERLHRQRFLDAWAKQEGFSYTAAQLHRYQELIATEGRAALQDIGMRVERESMHAALEELRIETPQLGARADAALAMLAAMFDTSSILETNEVPRETLVRMGYVTEFVKEGAERWSDSRWFSWR